MPLDSFVSLADGGACHVEHFVEKPSLALADTLIAAGAFWNTGIFVWQAQTVLDELAACVPEIAHGLPFLAAGEMPLFVEHIADSISIDRGLLERSSKVVMLSAAFGWDDVGTWASLRRVRELDDTGNGVMGTVHCVDASGNIVHCEQGETVVYGVSGLLVVNIDGLTFVTTLDRATELGPLIAQLPPHLRVRPGRHRPSRSRARRGRAAAPRVKLARCTARRRGGSSSNPCYAHAHSYLPSGPHRHSPAAAARHCFPHRPAARAGARRHGRAAASLPRHRRQRDRPQHRRFAALARRASQLP